MTAMCCCYIAWKGFIHADADKSSPYNIWIKSHPKTIKIHRYTVQSIFRQLFPGPLEQSRCKWKGKKLDKGRLEAAEKRKMERTWSVVWKEREDGEDKGVRREEVKDSQVLTSWPWQLYATYGITRLQAIEDCIEDCMTPLPVRFINSVNKSLCAPNRPFDWSTQFRIN